MFDFFTHMHNKKHRQTLDPYNRPWASKTQSETKQDSIKRIDKITVPAKGSEFLIPITGYYCQLCHEFFGDQISAEQHVKSHPHNEKYKKYIDENPLYEERRNLDRQAGLAVVLETERRRQNELKRKLVEKQKEEKDEKKPKIIKKEEAKSIPELGEGTSETQGKIDSSGRKMGIKLKLKKEDKEEKKEEKKEESKKESPSRTSFGKFSWKKTEREDKTPGAAIPKEESTEGNKEENKCQSGKPHVKPIEIKLSGKTVIPHTSPWTPVVSTLTPAKILPNLPVPTMIFRKSATATVSKPAPLNTFLSIKSSGATTKPLPVVKETNADLLLPPDIISKAFGGEEVILKGAEGDLKAAEKSESSQTAGIPPPPLPLLPVQQAAAIPADEVAPGVSESEQTILAMPVRPPPLPPSTAFSDQAKKVEKRNSCLATANAKDLYDIFYSSGGKGSADSKLASSALPNGDNSNLTKPADLSANPRINNSSSSLKEDSQNVAAEVSQARSAERSSELEKTDIQETSMLHTEMSPDIENGIQKDVGQKCQTSSTDVQTKLKEGSSHCNNQVTGSWVLGENQAEMNRKPLQPQLSEMSVTELPETKTASGIQTPAKAGLLDTGGREQVGCQELYDLQKTEVQEKVGQENANKTAVNNTNVPGTLEKDAEMKDREVKAVKPELSLYPRTLLPEALNEIKNLGNSHLVEEKLRDSCRTHSETKSPNLLCDSQNTSKEKALVTVTREQNSTDASLKDIKLKNVALEVSQPGVLGEAPQISETQNTISELTRSPGQWDTSRTSNGEEQVIATGSCSRSDWDLSNTPNTEIKTGSNEVSTSELTEVQPDTGLTNTETRSSISEVQEKVQPEPSGYAVLDNQTQRQEVACLVNACSANIVELGSSAELVVEVEKKLLGHTRSDATLDNVFIKRDAKEVGSGGISRARSDLVQESVVALSADFHRDHLSEEAVQSSETKHEVVRTSAANDFHLNTTDSGLKIEQSESLSKNVCVDNKVSLTSEDVNHSKTPSQKAELEFRSTDFSLGDTKVKHECFSMFTAGLLNEDTEEVSKLETIGSIRLGVEKTMDETEVTDVATLTSISPEDKFCTQVSQTATPQLGLKSSNSDTTEVVMPVGEMQGISPRSEILLQVKESKGGAAEMPSLSCDGGSTESQASGCVETFPPGLKETHGKEGGSGGKGLCTIQSKKTEQTETADSSLEATANSGVTESLAERPVG